MFFLFYFVCAVPLPQIKDKQSLYASPLVVLLHLAAKGAEGKELPCRTKGVLLFHLEYS